MKSEDRIELFKGSETGLGRWCRFDRSVVVDVVYHWDACNGARNG